MSRAVSVRACDGSALDAICDGPQARWLGVTRRLHDVATRYAMLIGAATLPIRQSDFPLIAAAAGPIPTDPRLLRSWLVNAADDAAIPSGAALIRNAEPVAIVALAEQIEEVIARA